MIANKITFSWMCVLALLVGIAGCSPQTNASDAAPGHGTLHFPDTGHPPTAAEIQQIMKAHPAPKNAPGQTLAGNASS